MLPKKYRLAKDADIKRVLKSGRSFFTPHLSLKYILRDQASPKFTVVVSSKAAKLAVRRNRVKRLLRVVFAKALPKLACGDYLLRLKTGAGPAQDQDLIQEAEYLLKKAGWVKMQQ